MWPNSSDTVCSIACSYFARGYSQHSLVWTVCETVLKNTERMGDNGGRSSVCHTAFSIEEL